REEIGYSVGTEHSLPFQKSNSHYAWVQSAPHPSHEIQKYDRN
ncbi:unnamed protein product, partial [marine sediment metagenome]